MRMFCGTRVRVRDGQEPLTGIPGWRKFIGKYEHAGHTVQLVHTYKKNLK